MIFCFWWIWEKVDEAQCTCDEIIFQQSPKIITRVKWKMSSAITSWRSVSLTMICPLQLLKIPRNKLVICHFWILRVTTAHQVFRLFLVLAMHWSSKCIGEAERDVPSYASTFGRSVIYAIMHSALCTPSLPPQSPIFAIMHGKPGLFTSCQFLPRIPPCLKTERSKLHQKIRNLTKEVKIELGQTTNPINRLRVA